MVTRKIARKVATPPATVDQSKQPTRRKKVPPWQGMRPIKGPDSSRGVLLRALDNLGNQIEHEGGSATRILYDEMVMLGYSANMSAVTGLLGAMENEGLVKRELNENGRRCYAIWLPPPPKEAKTVKTVKVKKVQPKPVPEVVQVNVPDVVIDNVDPELARLLEEEQTILENEQKSIAQDEIDGSAISDDEVAELLPALIDAIGDAHIVDVLLERASRGGTPHDEVEARLSALEAEWSEKLVAVTRELTTTKTDAAWAAREQARLEKEMVSLKETTDALIEDASKEIADLQAQLAAAKAPAPKRQSSRDNSSLIKEAIARARK
jgi:hypothetical protein